MTKVDLVLIPNPDMFFEKSTRDGVSYISNRYSKTSNNCLKYYDQNKNQNILYTQIRRKIIYMAMQCLNLFQQVDSNG